MRRIKDNDFPFRRVLLITFVGLCAVFAAHADLNDMRSQWACLKEFHFCIRPMGGWQVHKTEHNKIIIKNRNLDSSASLLIVIIPSTLPEFEYLVYEGTSTNSVTNITVVTQRGIIVTNQNVHTESAFGVQYDKIWAREEKLIEDFRQAVPMFKDIEIIDRDVISWIDTTVTYETIGQKFEKGVWQKYRACIFIINRNRFLYYIVINRPADRDIEAIHRSLRSTLNTIGIEQVTSRSYVNTQWDYSLWVPSTWMRITNNASEIKFVHESGANIYIRASHSTAIPDLSEISNDASSLERYVRHMRRLDVQGWKNRKGVALIKERTTITEINDSTAIYDMAKYQAGESVFDEYNILISENNIIYHIIVTRERSDETASQEDTLRQNIERIVNSFATY